MSIYVWVQQQFPKGEVVKDQRLCDAVFLLDSHSVKFRKFTLFINRNEEKDKKKEWI